MSAFEWLEDGDYTARAIAISIDRNHDEAMAGLIERGYVVDGKMDAAKVNALSALIALPLFDGWKDIYGRSMLIPAINELHDADKDEAVFFLLASLHEKLSLPLHDDYFYLIASSEVLAQFIYELILDLEDCLTE